MYRGSYTIDGTTTMTPALADLLQGVVLFPQTLVNVRLQPGQDWKANTRLQEAIVQAEQQLGAEGRVLIRASGTEPLLRIMVEARDAAQAQALAQQMAAQAAANT